MSELDKTHDANQTIRTTAISGHMTPNSGHTKSKYGDAHAEWLTSLTPEEMSAYKTGRRDATLEHQKYIRRYLSCRNVLTKIARGEHKHPAAAARFILSTLGDDA